MTGREQAETTVEARLAEAAMWRVHLTEIEAPTTSIAAASPASRRTSTGRAGLCEARLASFKAASRAAMISGA